MRLQHEPIRGDVPQQDIALRMERVHQRGIGQLERHAIEAQHGEQGAVIEQHRAGTGMADIGHISVGFALPRRGTKHGREPPAPCGPVPRGAD